MMYESWQTLVKGGNNIGKEMVSRLKERGVRVAGEHCAVSVHNANDSGKLKWQKDVLTPLREQRCVDEPSGKTWRKTGCVDDVVKC